MSRGTTAPDEAALVARYLGTRSDAELRALLLESIDRDPVLRDKLLLAARAGGSRDLQSLRAAVRQATGGSRGPYPAGSGTSLASRLEDLADMLDGRIDEGDPGLVELIEVAILQAGEAADSVADEWDDDVLGALKALQAVHVSACNILRPDPVALGHRLYDCQLADPWGTFSDVLHDYAEALGVDGLIAYRTRVLAAWQALPPLTAADRQRPREPGRRDVESLMEALVELTGDVDEMVRVKSRNLAGPERYLAIAELCRKHGRDDEALRWAEQGLAAFPDERPGALMDLCIEANLGADNHDRAEQLAWARFAHRAEHEAYFQLAAVGERLGKGVTLRSRALAHLWERVATDESRPKRQRSPWDRPVRDALVAIFLRERAADSMWAAFCGGPVSVGLWREVADLRGRTHPEEGIDLYKRLLPHAVEEGMRGARYDDAFRIVAAIRELRLAHGGRAKFVEELAAIRLQWKPKRNFMKLLDGLGRR